MLTLQIELKSNFGGNRIIHTAARDADEFNSGWQVAGTWTR